jgi:hypothetical protein
MQEFVKIPSITPTFLVVALRNSPVKTVNLTFSVTPVITTAKTPEIAPTFSLFQTEKTQIPDIFSTTPTKRVITRANVHLTTPAKTVTCSCLAQCNPVKMQESVQTLLTTLISFAIVLNRTPTKFVRPSCHARINHV